MELIAPMWVAWDEPCDEPVVVEPLLVEPAMIEADAGCCCGEATETMVAGEFLGDVVASAESVDGLTVIGEDVVFDAPPAEILPTLREEEVREAEPLGTLAPAGEAGSSVLVEQGASAQTPAASDPAAEPVVHEPLRMDVPKAAEPVEPEVVAEPVAPNPAPPASEPEQEPVNIFEAEEGAGASLEPTRRWIHARGDRSLVARLVGMPDADTCLLESAGRRIRVPLASLSRHDQVYVQLIGERLAAARAAAKPRDTAGL